MSRIGKQPIKIPTGVKVAISGAKVDVTGPKGTLSWTVPAGVQATVSANEVILTRASDDSPVRALHGMSRSLVANLVRGVSAGFERKLFIDGIGYRAALASGGRSIELALGFSHPVEFLLPAGITAKTEKPTEVVVSGIDKYLVGEVAARLRRLRPAEPYKGKGIRYDGEVIRRKVGKAGK
ncbi:MAG: 50S ribosomal protein L6 [Candidatus Schekmanbacteria bacterium]|nr:50S ribosomal protein L6 [Candidatus Schekmanbacteria bacterium]